MFNRMSGIVLLVVLWAGLAGPPLAQALVFCGEDAELEQKADLVVTGTVAQVSPEDSSGRRLRLAVLEVEAVVKGERPAGPVTIEFTALEETLEPDVQDAQLDMAGERGTAYLAELANGHYRVLDGLCGWKFISAPRRGSVVKVSGEKAHWELTVNGQPFYIKGFGVGHAFSADQKVDFLRLAADMGANAVRTWGIGQATREYLDRAHAYGLMVDVGFWLNPVYPDGTCSYLTDRIYREEVREQVLAYVRDHRQHPAVLAWNIGNETIYWTRDEKERVGFCRFLEKLIQEVHQFDPDHPVIYTSAYTTDAQYIAQYVPSLDILGINVYGAVQTTHSELKAQQKIPLVFTEFGPTGPWDMPKDLNQRPQEFNDQEKADLYVREAQAMFANRGLNLGGFAFFLGETSQISLTWWNVNYGGSRKLALLRLRDLYTGVPDARQYPVVARMELSKVDQLRPGERVQITLDVQGVGQSLAYAYLASTERDSDLVENPNECLPLRFDVQDHQASFKAPTRPGVYRIYGVLSDRDLNYTSSLSRTIRVVADPAEGERPVLAIPGDGSWGEAGADK